MKSYIFGSVWSATGICKRYITCFSSLIQDGIKMTVEPIVLTLVLVRVSQSTRCFIFIIGKNAEINVMKAVDTK